MLFSHRHTRDGSEDIADMDVMFVLLKVNDDISRNAAMHIFGPLL